ncbi:MAG: hypothetical protein CME71_11085 [Halobacteriovorax sp.]|nr:hypothetical protein [Halobacteriovorax sp.]|tara:strand:- start:3786 stop:3989 length:204 start_codon:yes stop_codon:yes gene_type:complete
MKITYDKNADALYIELDDQTPAHETQELRPDLMIDKSNDGRLLGIEILGVSSKVPADQLKNISYEVA